jgi:hypothetical protein
MSATESPDTASLAVNGAICELAANAAPRPGWKNDTRQVEFNWPDETGLKAQVEARGQVLLWSSPEMVAKRLAEGCGFVLAIDAARMTRSRIVLRDGMVLMTRARGARGSSSAAPPEEPKPYNTYHAYAGLLFLGSGVYALSTGQVPFFGPEVLTGGWKHGIGGFLLLCGVYLVWQPTLFSRWRTADSSRTEEDIKRSEVMAAVVVLLIAIPALILLGPELVARLSYSMAGGRGGRADWGEPLFYLFLVFLFLIPYFPSFFNVTARMVEGLAARLGIGGVVVILAAIVAGVIALAWR